jgi:hypothetical protein
MNTKSINAMFAQLYDLLQQVDTPEAEEALGYLAQAQAAYHGETTEDEGESK